jgi:hypothetical protein
MTTPTLDEFLARTEWPNNSHVSEPGFDTLYVRRSQRLIGDRLHPAVDIANVTSSKPGSGAFTALIARLKKSHPHLVIYVENVLNERLAAKLPRDLGFIKDPRNPLSYYLPAAEGTKRKAS